MMHFNRKNACSYLFFCKCGIDFNATLHFDVKSNNINKGRRLIGLVRNMTKCQKLALFRRRCIFVNCFEETSTTFFNEDWCVCCLFLYYYSIVY